MDSCKGEKFLSDCRGVFFAGFVKFNLKKVPVPFDMVAEALDMVFAVVWLVIAEVPVSYFILENVYEPPEILISEMVPGIVVVL